MLTLDQVRAVNDGLKSGDIHAALQPLEETIDLRHAEMPRLEKSAVAALRSSLHDPATAEEWAEALFHPNVSVRRFARKTLLGLKSDAASAAAPLQTRLERFWAQETPLSESNKAREAALRREQIEIVESAVEILLRADPQAFLRFYEATLDAQPAEADRAHEWEQWQARQRLYSQAVQKKQKEIIREEWGAEFLEEDKRHQLPWRVWREISERVQRDPEIKKLLADLGEHPWQRASQQWNPEIYFQSAMNQVLLPDATGPQREIATVIRPRLWQWIEDAFNEQLPADQARVALNRARHAVPNAWSWQQVGREEFWERVPALLTQSKGSLLSQIQSLLTKHQVYGKTRAWLWVQLTQALAQSCHKPYNFKGKWIVPPHITPDLLRNLKVKAKQDYLRTSLENAAQHLEKQQKSAAAEVTASTHASARSVIIRPDIAPPDLLLSDMGPTETTPLETAPSETTPTPKNASQKQDASQKNASEVLAQAEPYTLHFSREASQHEGEHAGEVADGIAGRAPRSSEEIADATSYFDHTTAELRQEIEATQDIDEKVAKLIELPQRTDEVKDKNAGLSWSQPVISRMPYWRIWKKQAGFAPLKAMLWPRVGPALWARYESMLEEYRRVETDDPAPILEQKLTPRELKQWKTEQRRRKRIEIQSELNDIAALLREVEGFETEERLIALHQRPGVSEVAFAHANMLLQRLGSIPYRGSLVKPEAPQSQWWREHWFLDTKWGRLLEYVEKQLLSSKRQNDWQRAFFLSSLSITYYRLNTVSSREKFLELMRQNENAPHGLSAPVVALGDVEAWLLLLERLQWPDAVLKELWTRARQSAPPEQTHLLTEKVLQLLSTTSREKGAKFMLEMLSEVPATQLQTHLALVLAALESPVVAVKRWALGVLTQLHSEVEAGVKSNGVNNRIDFEYATMFEHATTLATEMLWSENTGLVKDAARFLGSRKGEHALSAWDALQDAASLENPAILEAIFRALAALKTKNKKLQPGEAACEKLAELCRVSPERFVKFGKKLEVRHDPA